MRNDVKTLIAALTTERNAIDRAIAGLKQMSDMRDEAPADLKPRYGHRKGAKLSPATRRAMSEAKKAWWAMRRASHGALAPIAADNGTVELTPELAGSLQ